MLKEYVLKFVPASYGILLGIFLPLIFLDVKCYFRKNKLGIINVLKYLGRIYIIMLLFGVLFMPYFYLITVKYKEGNIDLIINSPWYPIGFFIGLSTGLIFFIIGLRKAKK
jgi:hypothetical protein